MTEKENVDLVLKELAKPGYLKGISYILNYSKIDIQKPLEQSSPEELLELFKKSPIEVYTDEKSLYLMDTGFHKREKVSLYKTLLRHGIRTVFELYQDGFYSFVKEEEEEYS